VPLRYLGPVPDDQWRVLLTEHLDRADEFRVHVPDGDGPLSFGRQEFEVLPDVEVRPWTGMRDAIEITGPLTSAARELFLQLEPTIETYVVEEKLWDYQLVRAGVVTLHIGDFQDLLVDVEP